MLSRIELWFQLPQHQFFAQLMGSRIENIEALIQLRGAIAPKSYPFAVRAIIKVVSHAEINRPGSFFPEDIVIIVIALKRTGKGGVVPGFPVLHRLDGDTRGNRVNGAFAANPLLGFNGLVAFPGRG